MAIWVVSGGQLPRHFKSRYEGNKDVEVETSLGTNLKKQQNE